MSSDLTHLPPPNVHTRWASAENYDATPGAGGQADHGRKGSPCRSVKAGESFSLAHAEGSGTVHRIWVTISEREPALLRGLVLRAWWDEAEKPAIEAPLGDFFGLGLGRNTAFENAWFDNPEGRSFNCRLPMPFRRGFRMTVTNESPRDLGAFFYDVNFTLGDDHGEDTGYLHAHWRRQNPTRMREDFEILPRVEGRGRFLGCTLGVLADTARYGSSWWGEGEVKVYLDGDQEWPTLCGTGTEDYIATGWGQGHYAHLWHGCPIADHERMQYSFYRLHGPDPVWFHRECRVTIQQMGGWGKDGAREFMAANGIDSFVTPGDGTGRMTVADLEQPDAPAFFLNEREDDWSACAYFLLDRPESSLPAIQPYEERVAALTGD
jgi:hypothetical protein